jgi:hypothetical protein
VARWGVLELGMMEYIWEKIYTSTHPLSSCSIVQKSRRKGGGEGEIDKNVQMSNRCKNIGMARTGMVYGGGNVWEVPVVKRGSPTYHTI